MPWSGGRSEAPSEEEPVESAYSCPPIGRFLSGLISDREVRRIESDLSPIQTLDSGRGQTGCQKSALHGMSGPAAQEHLLDVIYQGAEEIRQCGAAVRHGQIHL